MQELNDRYSLPVPETLKRINMRRFLEELWKKSPTTRADLTRNTEVSSATSSKVISELEALGYVEQLDSPQSTSGRPGALFQLSRSKMVVAGVSLESGMSHFVLSGLDGKPVDGTAQTFIAGDSYEGILESIRSLLDSCSSNISGVCGGLCITLPGLLNEDDGVVLFSTNYPMLNGRKIGSDLAQMLKVPVICRQENHALVIGERRLGENPNLTNFAVCDVGVGIGLGIFEQERFIVGESNFTGEIGHVSLDPIHGAICSCGRRGCFETLCSERALINNLKIALGREINVDEIGYLFKNQTASTSVIFEAFTSNLALLMSIIVNTLNPAAIMITGSICDHAPELVPLVAEKCKQFALEHILDNCTITTGSVSKVSGATACMIDELFSQVGPLLS